MFKIIKNTCRVAPFGFILDWNSITWLNHIKEISTYRVGSSTITDVYYYRNSSCIKFEFDIGLVSACLLTDKKICLDRFLSYTYYVYITSKRKEIK